MVDPASLALGVAQIFAPPFISPLIQKLFDGWLEESPSNAELEKEIQDLSSTMQIISKFLQDADNKQSQDSDVHTWLRRLKEVFYDAEDILDEYATDVAIKKMDTAYEGKTHAVTEAVHAKSEWRAKVRRAFSSCFNSSGTSRFTSNDPLKVMEDIKKINESLSGLLDVRSGLGLQIVKEPCRDLLLERRKTTWFPDDFPVEGRKEDIEKLKIDIFQILDIQKLSCAISNRNKSSKFIFPVIGMGGMGKTTTAKNIFNDHEIDTYFRNMKVWICVPNNSSAEDLLTNIIDSIYHSTGQDKRCEWTDLGILQKELLNLIEGNRFFLILDDIWLENIKIWEPILKVLRAANKGSICVIITTRYTKIANVIKDCHEPFNLQGLHEEDLFKILRMYAFGDSDKDSVNERQLEDIGRKIVKRLKGSPLAAKSIGGVLGSNCTRKFWIHVLESELWELENKEDGIFSILMLSYQNLPSYLKHCLIYFSLFPKDYNFKKSEIIHLWMANGCIDERNKMSIEDVGEMYLKCFVDRSLLEYDHDRETYIMHDLVHDLVRSISKYDCYWTNDGKKTREEKSLRFRHMSFIRAKDDIFVTEMCHDKLKYQSTCTVLFNEYYNFREINDMVGYMLESASYLRALILSNCDMIVLPDSICKLKHLRLLDLSHSHHLEMLPKSLGNLYNLQILNVDHCWGLKAFPRSITSLVNLKHLIGHGWLFSTIRNIGKLCGLRSSIVFVIRYDDDGFQISELKDLNLLQERLEIRNLEVVKCKDKAIEAHIENKVDLKYLKLAWRSRVENGMNSSEGVVDINQYMKVEEDVLEALKPYKETIGICIDGYKGMSPPSWLNASCLSSLETLEMTFCKNLDKMPPNEAWPSSLQVLKLTNCTKLEMFPLHLEKMQLLRRLHLEMLPGLKEIKWEMISSNGGKYCLFNFLEELVISNMPGLVEWHVNDGEEFKWESMNIFPRLTKFVISECPGLKYVHVPLLGVMLDFSNKCTLGESTSYSKHVSETALLPYMSNCLCCLTHLEIVGCPHVIYCDLLHTKITLKRLRIENCENLTCLRLPTRAMPLEVLRIDECPNLASCELPPPPTDVKYMNIRREDGVTQVQLQSSIYYGEKWRVSFHAPPKFCSPLSIPKSAVTTTNEMHGLFFPLPNRIEGLEIESLKEEEVAQLLIQIGACSEVHLKLLEIGSCPDLENFEGLHLALPSLTSSLTTSLDFRHIMSLKSLIVLDCRSLVSLLLPASMSTGLLCIGRCPDLLYVSNTSSHPSPGSSSSTVTVEVEGATGTISAVRNLLPVKAVDFNGCPARQIAVILQQIEPDNLETLRIIHCPDLKHFHSDDDRGVQLGPNLLNFTSLRYLLISVCGNLKSLPSELGTRLRLLEDVEVTFSPLLSRLPDLRPLTSLKRLKILGCPKLKNLYSDINKRNHLARFPDVAISIR